MWIPEIRVEYRGEWTLERLIEHVDIPMDSDKEHSFSTLEEMSEYLESIMLGTAITPFVLGNKEGDTDPVRLGHRPVVEPDKYVCLVGLKRLNAVARWLRGDFASTRCKFVPSLSDGNVFELPRRYYKRISGATMSVYIVENSGKFYGYGDDYYNDTVSLVRRWFNIGID